MDAPKILVVEDDRSLARVFADHLEADYAVDLAHTTAQAIDALDRGPDVVLLDRRLDDNSGDHVVAAIDAHRVDPRIAMVTGVDPDFDILELGIDEYIVKPTDGPTLRETVETLLGLDELHEKQVELSSKRLRRNLLEIEKSAAVLADHEEFGRLQDDIDALEREVASLEDSLGTTAAVA